MRRAPAPDFTGSCVHPRVGWPLAQPPRSVGPGLTCPLPPDCARVADGLVHRFLRNPGALPVPPLSLFPNLARTSWQASRRFSSALLGSSSPPPSCAARLGRSLLLSSLAPRLIERSPGAEPLHPRALLPGAWSPPAPPAPAHRRRWERRLAVVAAPGSVEPFPREQLDSRDLSMCGSSGSITGSRPGVRHQLPQG